MRSVWGQLPSGSLPRQPYFGTLISMAKKKRQRSRKPPPPTVDYTDSDGNVLVLRQTLTPATIAKINEALGRPAASTEDAWHRRQEMLFERLTVRWEIAELPLTEQAMLLGRYRIADSQEQAWVRETIDEHIQRHLPELAQAP